jgi:hypothetical protein
MTYKELPIGQKIKINEREFDDNSGRTRTVKRQYTVSAKYPHMCIVESRKGSRKRGLSLGDLVINGIIRQSAELEALRKEPGSREFRKGES